jgi:hypothetical protein
MCVHVCATREAEIDANTQYICNKERALYLS